MNFRFPGQYFDSETGLNYNVNRDYDSAAGRYIESDPLGLLAGPSAYGYGWLSPLHNIDPSGLIVKVVASDPDTASRLMNAYARLNRKSKRAREINGTLEKSCTVYEIRPIHHDDFYCPPGVEGQCKGHTYTAFIDPYDAPLLPTAEGLQAPPLDVIIGHELGHANGEVDDGPDPGNNVIYNENPIREDMGLPDRSSYTVDKIEWVQIK